MFESGVSKYVACKAEVHMFFPIDERGKSMVCCALCSYYRKTINRCGLTEEVIPFPDRYVGDGCPLEEIKEESNETVQTTESE